jgi:hypothetical protein
MLTSPHILYGCLGWRMHAGRVCASPQRTGAAARESPRRDRSGWLAPPAFQRLRQRQSFSRTQLLHCHSTYGNYETLKKLSKIVIIDLLAVLLCTLCPSRMTQSDRQPSPGHLAGKTPPCSAWSTLNAAPMAWWGEKYQRSAIHKHDA